MINQYEKTFYVDPENGSDKANGESLNVAFKTIQRARDEVRKFNSTANGNIIVYLVEGTYSVDSKIIFTGDDSGYGDNKVIYSSYEDNKPILTGGISLNGIWKLHNKSLNIYKMENVPGDFRQIYVNGEKAVRARSGNNIDDKINGEYYSLKNKKYPFKVESSRIDEWAANGETELVIISHWSQNRGRINHIEKNGDETTVFFKYPEKNFTYDHHAQDTGYYYLENAYELLDEPGEWYHDRQSLTLYYIPREGEIIEKAELIIPQTEVIFSFEGCEDNPVRNIEICGLEFMYTNWTAPDEYGYQTMQGGHAIQTDSFKKGIYGGIYSPVAGMINLKYTSNIKVERCSFKNSGAWGVMQQDGCIDNEYLGNVFKDLSSGAIAIGNALEPVIFRGFPEGTASGTVISNNLIENIGYEYKDCPGIIVLKSKNVKVMNNEIRHVPYSAISMGFEWNDSGKQGSSDNIISGNRIHHAMTLLDDGGGIYVLGNMTNSYIKDNYITCLISSKYNGGHPLASIYLDAGSCFWTIENNVSDFCIIHNFHLFHGIFTYSNNPPIHSNIGRLNFHSNKHVGYTGGYKTWEGNYSLRGEPWMDKAREVFRNSGIEKEYHDIGPVTCGDNIALDGTAKASSICKKIFTSPARAISNDPEDDFWCSDEEDKNPWWQIDLGKEFRLYNITVIARQDQDNPNCRRGFAILASNDENFNSFNVLDEIKDTTKFPYKGAYSCIIDDVKMYRFVRIAKSDNTSAFSIAECKIYGV